MGKTLVTGAAGFIGSHVTRELLAEGREVRAMILPGEDTRNLEGLAVETVEADLLQPDSLEAALRGVDRVFHLAALYAVWLPRREKIYEVNCVGSMNLLWAAYKAEVERVVYTSSAAAVGLRPGEAAADETVAFDQMGKANDYVYTKWLSEEEAKTFVRNGLSIVFCNPCFPFGPRDVAPTPTGQILLDIVNGKNRFYFDGGMNVVDVEDVARGHVLAEKNGRVGERYLLGNRNVSFKEFFELIARVTGASFKPRKLPVGLALPVADYLERRADTVTRKPPLFAGSALRYAKNYLYYDTQKASKELGYAPRPIEESIQRAVDWFAEHGYIENEKFLGEYRSRERS
ncbi:MAG: NAD-dependent epimerase/dehydratase family protein [Deltaproteobacteria bacterium]|nr:MAG: NAD-dependent epimerase/dehydratase family protein [Deltaproteobacteria bacterium]